MTLLWPSSRNSVSQRTLPTETHETFSTYLLWEDNMRASETKFLECRGSSEEIAEEKC